MYLKVKDTPFQSPKSAKMFSYPSGQKANKIHNTNTLWLSPTALEGRDFQQVKDNKRI